MWMKRYGWDAICRNGDGGEGTGGTSAGEASQGTATFDETDDGSGGGRGPGGQAAPGEPGANAPSPGSPNSQAPDPNTANVNDPMDFNNLDPIDRGVQLSLGSRSKGPPSGTSIGLAFSTAKTVGKAIDDFANSLGIETAAPPQGPSTGSEGGPESDFGESGNFDGVGFGGGNTGGDSAEPAASAPQRLARSVRSAGRNDAPASGAARTPAPAPSLDLPSSDIDDIRAELDAEREARRRRRRTTRQSTIVTGPLGVPGRPELLQPTAVAGVSRRLLGQ